MKRPLEWLLLIFLAAGGIFLWCRLALPRYQAIDLSVNQAKAVEIAKDYLKDKRGVDLKGYIYAVTINADDTTDRYLQKTLGTAASRQLLHRLHYDLFCWVVRFFKEKQKEEYKVAVDPATGEVNGFNHIIEDTAARPLVDKETARRMALDFLKTNFDFDPDKYITHGENDHKYDNRMEYSFSWQEKDVQVPWKKGKEHGSSKLLTSATVSGHEILSFNKFAFEIPDAFNRYVDNLKQTGDNLILVFRIIYLALITISIVVVVNRKSQVVARSVKMFYIGVGTVMFVLMLLDIINGYQELLYDYPTTQSLGDYIIRQIVESIIGPFFIAVGFVLPALGGESLRFEVLGANKNAGILSTLQSSFCSANVARQLLVGYIAASVAVGVQSVIFALGFKYCGVWDELSWLTQTSTSLIPAMTALVIGFQAAFSEEAMFRLFAINWLKKKGVPLFLCVFLSAAMWGFGHTGYEIFPMWFRGVEVTTIGLIMGFFYLRYGLICVIAAHFLIDSTYYNLPYFLKPHPSFDLYSSLTVMGLPAVLAMIAFLFNKNAPEKPLSLLFNSQQQFNYNLIQDICRSKSPQELAIFKKDLEQHGWDAAIIQRIFDKEE